MQNSASWVSLKHAYRSTLFLVWQHKAHQRYIRRRHRHQPPDHHYYQSSPLHEHHCVLVGALEARSVKAGAVVGSMPVVSSSCASVLSSESMRTMILSSPGGPRMSRLKSPKSFLVSFTSREVSTMKFSSSEDEERSIIGVFPEALPCSNTGEQGRHDDTSNGDPGGGGDLDGTSGGVLTSPGRGLPSVEGERYRLMHLLSSISG
jgi:hypothetical protein